MALDDGGLVLVGDHAAGRAQVLEFGGVQLQAAVGADDRAAGDDGHVFQQGLAPFSEAGSLDRHAVEDAAHLVDHQGGQRLAVHVLGNQHQRPPSGPHHFLQDGYEVVGGADLLVGEQEVGVVYGDFHPLRVSYEVGRKIAAVNADAFHEVQFVGQGLGLFDGDHAVSSHLLQRVRQLLGDGFLVRRQRGDAGHLFAAFHRNGHAAQLRNHGINGALDAYAKAHAIGSGGHVLETVANDGVGQYYRGGGAVAHGVVGLGGRFLDQLRPQVFVGVGQLDFLGDGDAVAAHHRVAEHPAEHHVAPAGPEGQADDAPQLLHAAQQTYTGSVIKR